MFQIVYKIIYQRGSNRRTCRAPWSVKNRYDLAPAVFAIFAKAVIRAEIDGEGFGGGIPGAGGAISQVAACAGASKPPKSSQARLGVSNFFMFLRVKGEILKGFFLLITYRLPGLTPFYKYFQVRKNKRKKVNF